MRLGYYNGYVFTSDKRIENKSCYNNNFYQGLDGIEVFAHSDDDDTTEYSIGGIVFAESHTSDGDVLVVSDEFINLEPGDLK